MCRKNKSVCAILVGAAFMSLLSACTVDGNGADTESQKVTDSVGRESADNAGGAADTEVYKLQLSESGYVIEEVFGSGSQEEKTDVEWYDLTEDNVEEHL